MLRMQVWDRHSACRGCATNLLDDPERVELFASIGNLPQAKSLAVNIDHAKGVLLGQELAGEGLPARWIGLLFRIVERRPARAADDVDYSSWRRRSAVAEC